MKQEIAKYFNRAYGFISGVAVTVSVIILGIAGITLWGLGIARGKSTTKQNGEDSMKT